MKKLRIAAILMFIHGAFMELGGTLMALPLMFSHKTDLSKFISFIVPYFQNNLLLISVIGGVYGVLRILGALGVWSNRKWGFVLSCINCTVTMILMIFMLPAGIIDGILSGTALILMLIAYFDKQPIIQK